MSGYPIAGDILGKLGAFSLGVLCARTYGSGLSASSYLFASEYLFDWLEQKALKMDSQGLLTFFPNLVVAVARIREIDAKEFDSYPPDYLVLTRRECSARIYKPIKPFKFMTDIVMGTERHLTELEENEVYLAEGHGESYPIHDEASVVVRDEDFLHWFRKTFELYKRDGTIRYTNIAVDSIQEIRFEADGRFLPETQEEAYNHSREGPLDREGLSVRFSNLQESPIPDTNDGSSLLTCNLRGIMSLFPPRDDKVLGNYPPQVNFIGDDLPIAEIMEEVCPNTGPLASIMLTLTLARYLRRNRGKSVCESKRGRDNTNSTFNPFEIRARACRVGGLKSRSCFDLPMVIPFVSFASNHHSKTPHPLP
jgi:hypothetical protein